MSNEISLVTGGNGHLGNNLVRLLLSENQKVRTTVRNINNQEPFKGLNCEVVQADITDRESLKKALQGVTNLYAVAANFSMWAKNPKTEIYDNNMQVDIPVDTDPCSGDIDPPLKWFVVLDRPTA